MLLKLVLATLILIVVFVGMVQIQRRIRGDGPAFHLKLGRGAKEERGTDDLKQFIEAYRRDPTLGKPVEPGLPAALAQASHPGRSTARPGPSVPFLSGVHKLAFLLLKSALPEYHVFPRVCLADIAPAASTSSGQLQAVDFLLCGRDFAIVCAVLLDEADGSARAAAIEEQLRAAGVRCVKLTPRTLPRPAQMRQLILA